MLDPLINLYIIYFAKTYKTSILEYKLKFIFIVLREKEGISTWHIR